MSDYIEYKGYMGTVEYSAEDSILYGKVIGIPKTLILYHGSSIEELKRDFQEAVTFYLDSCEEKRQKPVKPIYCGTLADIQIPPAIHMQIYNYSEAHSKTPSQTVEEALKRYLAV